MDFLSVFNVFNVSVFLLLSESSQSRQMDAGQVRLLCLYVNILS